LKFENVFVVLAWLLIFWPVQLEQHVNMYALVNLINFGSGFRHMLHSRKGIDRGAYETMVCESVLSVFVGLCSASAWLRSCLGY